jgi:hypothetical protein
MAAQATRPPASRPPVASFEVSSWFRTRTGRQLQPVTRHIILALAGYVNGKNRKAHPGMRKLAADTGYTPNTICKHVAIIEAIGLVTVTKTTRTNEYAWHGTRGIDAQVDRVLAEHPEWSHRRSKPAPDAAPDVPAPAAPVLVSGTALAADARREHAPVVVPEPAPKPVSVTPQPAPAAAVDLANVPPHVLDSYSFALHRLREALPEDRARLWRAMRQLSHYAAALPWLRETAEVRSLGVDF